MEEARVYPTTSQKTKDLQTKNAEIKFEETIMQCRILEITK